MIGIGRSCFAISVSRGHSWSYRLLWSWDGPSVLSWGKRLGRYTVAPISHWMQLSLEGAGPWGRQFSFQQKQRLKGTASWGLSPGSTPSSWGIHPFSLKADLRDTSQCSAYFVCSKWRDCAHLQVPALVSEENLEKHWNFRISFLPPPFFTVSERKQAETRFIFSPHLPTSLEDQRRYIQICSK